jgi:hypothetical protein
MCWKKVERCATFFSSGGGKNETNILQDMNNIAKELFVLQTTIPMYNKNVHVTAGSHRETSEKIMVFIKK